MFLELCLEGYCDIHSPHTVNLDSQIFLFLIFSSFLLYYIHIKYTCLSGFKRRGCINGSVYVSTEM